MGEKRIMHYSSSQNILLVGEGDFSFSLCLAKAFGSASKMTATSLDSKGSLLEKYSKASENLKELEIRGCNILHGVDVHIMSQHPTLQSKLFDQIVFNFPHTGFLGKESSLPQIKRHKRLVRRFLRNARQMLTKHGEIHITHKTTSPFSEWKIEELANEVGLKLAKEVPFFTRNYPGYSNRKGAGKNCDKSFNVGRCSTFIFVHNN